MNRTLVIGDIHGGLRALHQIMERAKVNTTDTLIFLGDYVDGWSQSPQVIDYLIDITGTPSHYYNYLPFGEEMVAQNNSSYNNVYRFSAKELDEDTGLSYFGARYYDPKFSIWLSVDPLAETMPFASPYNYCLQNPINLTDPDGREPVPPTLHNLLNGIKPSQWYVYAGIYHKKSFNSAATYNTKYLNASAYQSVYQRNAYYGWAQSQADAKGYGSKWFGAAELVTGIFAVGATESINLNVIKDNTESFLKAGNKFLFSHNMKNAKDLLADGKLSGGFTDANGKKQSFEGLTGIDLDNKMVEFEQSKVQDFISSYKGNDINAIITNINEMFTGTVAKTIGPAEINEVMKDSFNGGKSFNFKNYADRVKLGQELIKKAHNE